MARTVSWPTQGDQTTFRRRSITLGAALALALIAAFGTLVAIDPDTLRSALPLALGMGALSALWVHGSARATARRAELDRSFAGLVVVHHGVAYAVSQQPILGEYPNRRQAATAALDRGGWAIVIRAWDRYWLLDAAPVRAAQHGEPSPVSFRSRAVADVIPAIA